MSRVAKAVLGFLSIEGGAPAPISLILYATWYFFNDSCTSEYNVFYSDIQEPRQEPTNPDPDLLLRDQP